MGRVRGGEGGMGELIGFCVCGVRGSWSLERAGYAIRARGGGGGGRGGGRE